MRFLKPLTLVAISALVLAACGLKGPLYLPSDSTAGRPADQQQTDADKKDAGQKKQDDGNDDQDDGN